MTNIRALLAQNLKKYRHAIGLSQAKLAERVDSSTYYIGMMEIQRKFPSPEMIERLAAALGVDSTDLFLKEAVPDDVIREYRLAALKDIQWAVGNVFKERFLELGGEIVKEE